MRIVVVGPPGAGKGTQSKRIAKQWQLPHLSTGEMLRAVRQQQDDAGQQAAQYMDVGNLVPDDVVESIAFDRLQNTDCDGGFILDGFPRTESQAKSFDRWLDARRQSLTAVLEFRVNEEELLDRISSRGRADDDRQVVRQRLQQYYELTHPLLDYYGDQNLLKVVDGLGTTDEVFARVCQLLPQK